ncbi:hypothetical protein ANN_14565 [Periplaneta americana]|uniref:Uncharacterized protein n=1 Tax=Periplaneta americana TaxID=6978 RepID=A0ABQ8SXX3_PERAM|nr:hypothetical protein ANN_14565 [Periplaneta americana]
MPSRVTRIVAGLWQLCNVGTRGQDGIVRGDYVGSHKSGIETLFEATFKWEIGFKSRSGDSGFTWTAFSPEGCFFYNGSKFIIFNESEIKRKVILLPPRVMGLTEDTVCSNYGIDVVSSPHILQGCPGPSHDTTYIMLKDDYTFLFLLYYSPEEMQIVRKAHGTKQMQFVDCGSPRLGRVCRGRLVLTLVQLIAPRPPCSAAQATIAFLTRSDQDAALAMEIYVTYLTTVLQHPTTS